MSNSGEPKARQIAELFHGEQKYGDKPYMFHVTGVVEQFDDPTHRIVAYLHDLVEDGHITITALRMIFTDDIMNAVAAITRRREETYDAYIKRCSENEIARKVKLADLAFNLSQSGKPELTERYRKAQEFLRQIEGGE